MFGRVPCLPFDFILPTCHSTTPSQSKSSLCWKSERSNEKSLPTSFSTLQWKKNVIRRKNKRPFLTTLEPGDWVRTDKMRSYWEEQVKISMAIKIVPQTWRHSKELKVPQTWMHSIEILVPQIWSHPKKLVVAQIWRHSKESLVP